MIIAKKKNKSSKPWKEKGGAEVDWHLSVVMKNYENETSSESRTPSKTRDFKHRFT